MTEGTSQGLFIVVAIVIFGIFVSLSYTLFGKTLQPAVTSLFKDSTEQVAYDLKTASGYNPIDNSDVVYIQDNDLKRVIKDTLNVEEDSDITVLSMKKITAIRANKGMKHDYSDISISSLKGLEYATNLKELWLHDNRVKSLEPIKDLVKLEALNVNYNEGITSVEPLRKLVNLNQLMVERNNIKNVEPLKDLVNLKLLNVGENPIDNIDSLSRLDALNKLYIDRTNISDISVVSNFKRLNLIHIYETNITDLSPASHVTDIVTVNPRN